MPFKLVAFAKYAYAGLEPHAATLEPAIIDAQVADACFVLHQDEE